MAIQAELRLGIRDFKANLDRATQEVRKSAGTMKRETEGVGASLANGFKGVGRDVLGAVGLTGGIVGIGVAVKSALEDADRIADLTLKLQDSAEAIQKVDYAAKLSDSSVEQVADSMIKLERALGDVENKKAAAALEHLGLSAGELASMSLDEKIIALSDAFEKARASGTGVNDIQALLGRSAADLIPLLEQGGNALRGMFEEAPVLAEGVVQEMARINDEFDAMIMKGKALVTNAVGGLAKVRDAGAATLADRANGNPEDVGISAMDIVMPGLSAAKMLFDLTKADGGIAKAQQKEFDREIKEQEAAANRGRERMRTATAQQANQENAAKIAAEKIIADNWAKAEAEATADILDRQEKQAKEKEDRDKKRAEELAKAREQAEAGGFALLSPEEQAAQLRDQLAASLGIDVKSMADVDAGLAAQRAKVADARARGDVVAEKAALDDLNKSQELTKEFMDTAAALAPEAPAGGVGSLAGLVNQMFGRDPQAQQVDELKRIVKGTEEHAKLLNEVIKEMKAQPPPVAFARL